MKPQNAQLKTSVLNRSWLSGKTFEMELAKPSAFNFIPGQRIRFVYGSYERDYSLTSDPLESTLRICVRNVESGTFSPILASAEMGAFFSFTGPHGYFTYHEAPRTSVWVATGTGIAPFVSMARSGVRDFILLHGVSSNEDLYYKALLKSSARQYTPCISEANSRPAIPMHCFKGRVTDYIKAHLNREPYEFYLCGSGDMIRDVTLLIDDHFSDSRVHTEIYY